MKKQGWSAAQASVEGWAILTSVAWLDGGQFPDGCTRIGEKIVTIGNSGGFKSDAEAAAFVMSKAPKSPYHAYALDMVGVETMKWSPLGERIGRTFVRHDGDVQELRL